MYKLTLMKIYKLELIVYLIVCVLSLTLVNIITSNVEFDNQQISGNLAYYNGENSEDLVEELKQEEIEYTYGQPIEAISKFEEPTNYTIVENVEEKANIKEMNYLENTSSELINDNNMKLLQGEVLNSFNLKISLVPKIIDGSIINYNSSGLRLITGNYPFGEKDIVIPESYALELIKNDKAYNSYDELIGTPTTINYEDNKHQYTISGISLGSDFFVSENEKVRTQFIQSNPEANKAVYIKFNTERAKKQFMNNSDFNLLDNSQLNQQKLIKNSVVWAKIIALIIMNTIIIYYDIKIAKKLNYFNESKINYILPLIIPALMINGIILIL